MAHRKITEHFTGQFFYR